MNHPSILLIYTGGTIGMMQDPETLALKPYNFSQIIEEVPALKKFGYTLDTYSFNPLIDSSDVNVDFWIRLSNLIKEKYELYDGFVVLHGTDTMSYSASAMSFMLQDLEKPIIFTGSQLPIGMLRTDGKENLISSIEIAATKGPDGHSIVPEVCVYFETYLYRGNRTTKYNAENFRAFRSANYPVLADTGIHIKYMTQNIRYPKIWGKKLKIASHLDTNVLVIKVIPGLKPEILDYILHAKGLRAVILETYGSGNAPTRKEFLEPIKKAIDKGIIILNVSQCHAGRVDMAAYEAGITLKNTGVISGDDITLEAALCKLYYLLGQSKENENIKSLLEKNISGEISKKLV
ncbi:MAG: asparaginase [Bacteroidales bacterium]